MTNTTELRKDKSLGNLIVQHLAEVIKAGNDLSEHIITPEIYLAKTDQIACGLVDKVTGLIEAAERRRTEEIIEFLKELGKEDEGDFWDMAYSGIANDIKDKFLTKPNHE